MELLEIPDKRDAIVADLFSIMYFDEDALLGRKDPEQTCLHSTQIPLHYFLASRIAFDLPEDFFWLDDDDQPKVVYGAPNNLSIPFPFDKEVNASYHSHSDFDLHTIYNSLDYIKQIKRWKKYVLYWPQSPMEGVEARLIKDFIWWPPHSPRYPLESLPDTISDHIRANRRKTYPDFANFIDSSPPLKLTIESELPKEYEGSFSRTFKCSLSKETLSTLGDIEIPGKLVLKLFDDYRSMLPEDGYPSPRIVPERWAIAFQTAYECLYNERRAYLRLKHVWGSTIPWFYGAFMVRPFYVHCMML